MESISFILNRPMFLTMPFFLWRNILKSFLIHDSAGRMNLKIYLVSHRNQWMRKRFKLLKFVNLISENYNKGFTILEYTLPIRDAPGNCRFAIMHFLFLLKKQILFLFQANCYMLFLTLPNQSGSHPG